MKNINEAKTKGYYCVWGQMEICGIFRGVYWTGNAWGFSDRVKKYVYLGHAKNAINKIKTTNMMEDVLSCYILFLGENKERMYVDVVKERELESGEESLIRATGLK